MVFNFNPNNETPRKSIPTEARHLMQKRSRSVQKCGLQRRARNPIKSKKINEKITTFSHFTPLPGRPCGTDFYHFFEGDFCEFYFSGFYSQTPVTAELQSVDRRCVQCWWRSLWSVLVATDSARCVLEHDNDVCVRDSSADLRRWRAERQSSAAQRSERRHRIRYFNQTTRPGVRSPEIFDSYFRSP